MDLALTRLCSDREIISNTILQLMDIRTAIQISEEANNELFRRVIDVAQKLESVKHHRDALEKVLAETTEAKSKEPREKNVAVIDMTSGVEREFEAFLLQGKSTLDVLVKCLRPLFGIKLHSYGDGGTKVAKALRRNLPAPLLSRSSLLLELIERNKSWIEPWFTAKRDTIAHYEPLKSSGFVTFPDKGGRPMHSLPVTEEGVPLSDLADKLYEYLVRFCGDFIAFASSVRFPEALLLGPLPTDHQEPEYPRRYGMFLREQPNTPGAT